MERYKVIQIIKFYNDIDGHIAFARSALEEYEDKYYGLHGGNPLGGNSLKIQQDFKPHRSRRTEYSRFCKTNNGHIKFRD